MNISQLEHPYDTQCEYVDYKGNCYPFTIKRLNFVQIQWLINVNIKQNGSFDEISKEIASRSDDMDSYCDYLDTSNAKELKRMVKYIDSWCFEQEPSADNIITLYAQRDDVALGIIQTLATRYHEVFMGTRKEVEEVKKK